MKIITLTPNASDATSYYRAWGVFPDIMKRSDITFTDYYEAQGVVNQARVADANGQLISIPTKGFTWAQALQYDAVFLQRAFGNAVDIAAFMKDCGLKLIYELDDNLFEIPDNFSIKQAFNKEVLGTIEYLIRISDLVIVSTQALADYIEDKFQVKCEVVNNGIDLNRYPIQPYNENGGLVWRGSRTHIEDLRTFRSELEAIEEHISFWSHDPVKDRPYLSIKSYDFVKPMDIMYYMHNIRQIKPRGIITPLEANLFNACKSNIAYLEATIAGAISYSNQWGEFKGKGLNLSQINERSKEVHDEATQDLHDNYSLTKLNDRRIELLKGVL
jgi:hypothetical protein